MTDQRKIALATCRRWPDVGMSDAMLAKELEDRGHSVATLPWNDAPISNFTSADIVVLRSNWDYHNNLSAFERWLDAVDESSAELHNPAVLVRQNLNKSYLNHLAGLGVPTPATLILDEFDDGAIRAWMTRKDLEPIILKPAWGASGIDVERVEASELSDARTRREASPEHRGIIAQEFLPQVTDGETALVFFAGRFSHALRRQPAANEFRVNSQYAGTVTLVDHVDASTVSFAASVLATLPVVPTYARVDIVGSGPSVKLMELELNEPGLGLHLAPGSAARFADVLLA